MRELKTIQTNEKLNRVFAVDGAGPGGASHYYAIYADKGLQKPKRITIEFQKGPRKEEDSVQGVIDSDLLEIVRDRMIAFQNGPFASEYNAKAIEGIEIALNALNQRVEDRIKRNVLGRNDK